MMFWPNEEILRLAGCHTALDENTRAFEARRANVAALNEACPVCRRAYAEHMRSDIGAIRARAERAVSVGCDATTAKQLARDVVLLCEALGMKSE